MNWDDAFELARLRLEEDGVAWGLAYDEFRGLVGRPSHRETMLIARRLQDISIERDKRGSSK